jgi:hypothetical protein
MRIFLLFILLSLSYANWGGDGLWEISEGEHIRSFNGFEVTLLEIGKNGSGSPVNATYRISRNWTPLDEATLAPGQDYNFSVNGTGLTRTITVIVRLKELGLEGGIPYAETDVSSANFRYPQPPAIRSLNLTVLSDRATLSLETDIYSNVSILLTGSNTSQTVQMNERKPSHELTIGGLAQASDYSLSIVFCADTCNSTNLSFKTVGEPVKPEADNSALEPPVPQTANGLDPLPLVIAALLIIAVVIFFSRTGR